MMRFISATLLSGAAMVAAISPAYAGDKHERATAAIAAAQAKIDAGNKVGASGEVPQLQAQAEASLRTAKEDLAKGDKAQAIIDANHAAELADRAMGEAQKAQSMKAEVQTQQATVAASVAQQDAANANARAAASQQAAAAAAHEAATARATPQIVAVPVAAEPAPRTTTVTTETSTPAVATPRKTVAKRSVHRRPHHVARTSRVKTTTTVRTQ